MGTARLPPPQEEEGLASWLAITHWMGQVRWD